MSLPAKFFALADPVGPTIPANPITAGTSCSLFKFARSHLGRLSLEITAIES